MPIAALLTALIVSAHDGEMHREVETSASTKTPLAERPQRLPDGTLHVPKSVQHLLGIRTVAWSFSEHAATQELLAEVDAQPAAALTLVAPEPGRLEPAEAGWPLPGEHIQTGRVLAYLHPLLSARDIGRRRARLGDLDQKLVIAQINVDRLTLQAVGNDVTRVASGNTRYEQVVADLDAIKRQRQLIAESLDGRIAVRAVASGRLLSAPARNGDVVAAGTPLFQLVDAAKLRLTAVSYDANLAAQITAASLKIEGRDAALPLVFRGQEPLASALGWRLLFDVAEDAGPLSQGQLVSVAVHLNQTTSTLPPDACALGRKGSGVIWVHRAAETFVPLAASCTGNSALALEAGDRIVTRGGGLLSQYR